MMAKPNTRGLPTSPPPGPYDAELFAQSMRELPQRIASKIAFETATSCWLWQGSLATDGGYARCWTGKRVDRAARFVYETLYFELAPGRDFSPRCRNNACVNPDHCKSLERSDTLRLGLSGATLGDWNRSRTACPKGHAYSAENTSIRGGSRSCRACDRARAQRLRDSRSRLPSRSVELVTGSRG